MSREIKCVLGFHRKCVWYSNLYKLYYETVCREYYEKLRSGENDVESIDVCDLLAKPYGRDWLMFYCDRCIKSTYAKRFTKKTDKLSTVNTL